MRQTPSFLYPIAISMIPKLNNLLSLSLFKRCGGFEGFFLERENNLATLLAEHQLHSIKPDRDKWLEMAESEFETMQREAISFCDIDSPNYPVLLKECEDAPLVLFYKGRWRRDAERHLAIVGTRKASTRCRERVNSIVKQIAEMGYKPVIVSGLAFGIDSAAHRAALNHNLPTYAVLGHGLNSIYPANHKELAEKIIDDGGALISEFPCAAKTLPINFLQRNRVIAGLSDAVLIAESAVKGGAMATARLAFSYNRTVLAIPGRPEDRNSAGCNLLIKKDIAAVAEEAADILPALNWRVKSSSPIQISLDLFSEPEKEESIIKILEQHGDIGIDELFLVSKIPISKLSTLLLKMELEGVVSSLPGKRYTLSQK